MKTNKKNSESTALRLNSISEEQLEDVLFTFLGEVSKERLRIAEKRKRKFLNMLAQLGPTEAEEFLDTLGKGMDEQQSPNDASPTIGDVIRRFMEVQIISANDLASKIGAAVASVDGLLNESYRVSENGLKDLVTSLAMKYKIGNHTALRQVVATGYRLFTLKPSTVGPLRIAARRRHK